MKCKSMRVYAHTHSHSHTHLHIHTKTHNTTYKGTVASDNYVISCYFCSILQTIKIDSYGKSGLMKAKQFYICQNLCSV